VVSCPENRFSGALVRGRGIMVSTHWSLACSWQQTANEFRSRQCRLRVGRKHPSLFPHLGREAFTAALLPQSFGNVMCL